MIIRTITTFLTISFLISCNSYKPAKLPDAPYKRHELEKVDLQGRIIAIERNTPTPWGTTPFFTGTPEEFDRFLFWDYCRNQTPEWKLVEIRRDFSANNKWYYTETTQQISHDGKHINEPNVNKSFIKKPLTNYATIKQLGLSFFKTGLLQCKLSERTYFTR